MKTDEALQALADRYGIVPDYYNFNGELVTTSPDTQKAILNSIGVGLDSDAMIHESLALITAQQEQREYPEEYIVESMVASTLPFGAETAWQVICTEMGSIAAEGISDQHIVLPPLASGVYSLNMARADQKDSITLLVAPVRAPSITDISSIARQWGVNAALYGLRSGRNGGIGDYEDLARLGEILASKGAGFLGINPVHAIGAAANEVISPYSPSHRAMLNTEHIALDQLQGFTDSHRTIDQNSDQSPLIDYAMHKESHRRALEAEFVRLGAAGAAGSVDELSDADGLNATVSAFALFEAISERHGADWRRWPAELRDKNTNSLRLFEQEAGNRIKFHQWLQHVAGDQLESANARSKFAGMPLGLYLDLAVGSRRDGAECWCNQEVHALQVSIGAPPDYFNPLGQNWQLAAMSPHKLKAQRYRAFRQVLRATMRHAGVLRIDHVLGLNRSFWIPDNGAPGCYINQPCDALTAIVKIEAERSGTAIIGEDLGLVPDGFRDNMRSNGFYGYSVLQFEKDHNGEHRNPAHYESQILACFGTHDTTTLRGFSEGRDIDWSVNLDWINADKEKEARDARAHDVHRLKHNLAGSDDAILDKVVHSSLAYSPAELVSIQLDDILGHLDSQNLPGTIDEHPNWRGHYAVTLEDLPTHQYLNDTAVVMQEGDRSSGVDNN